MSDTNDEGGMFDEFADAIEQKLTGFNEQIRAFRLEVEAFRTEQRNAPVLPSQSIDTEAIATRAAALVSLPKDGVDGKDGRDGKDAVVNIEEIIARVAELTVPRVVALIPTPANGKDGTNGEPGERGEDGTASPDEIRSIAREEVLTNQRDFYRGVFAEGTQYRTADGVTWDGSMWFAQRDTKLKPGENNADWTLAVKRGRDGRERR